MIFKRIKVLGSYLATYDGLEKNILCGDFLNISVIFPNTAATCLNRIRNRSTLKRMQDIMGEESNEKIAPRQLVCIICIAFSTATDIKLR